MANTLTDDDELELEDEQRRKQAQDTIGKPLVYGPQEPANVKALNSPMPSPRASTVPPAMSPPDVGAAAPPSPSTISEAAPYNPPAPRPQSQAFTDWQAQDLTKHPVDQPRYHGLSRVADTIAQMTVPGQLAEVGGEMGTLGAQAKSKRLAGNAAEENTQIGYGEKEREANAKLEEEATRAQGEATGNELVTIDTPNGPVQVMRKNVATPTAAIINTQGRENVADINADARRDVAGTNAGAREDVARIMVGGKALGTKTVVGQDGKPHVMMWNTNTHTYDKDLGEAPPPASASAPYAKTRTVQLIDPETGLPTVYQYNSETNSYDKPVGVSATGAYGHEMAQAGAVDRAGTQLIEDIKTHRGALGTLQTWVEKYGLNTPIADPELARLQAELGTFSALQPAMHGFRSRNAMETFEAIIGGLQKNPDATIASIEGILQTAGNIKGKGSPSKPTATGGGVSAPPPKTKQMQWNPQAGRYE